MSVLGLNSKGRKSTRDKANISNPKVNRGCAPLTANRISADCVQISLGPSIPYIPLGVYHTGRFNAMRIEIWPMKSWNKSQAVLKLISYPWFQAQKANKTELGYFFVVNMTKLLKRLSF